MIDRLRWHDHIRINLFWLGMNIRNNAVSSAIMPYLVAILAPAEIRNTALGFLATAGLFIAMLVQPAVGILSDRSTSPYGRRRPFIFVGVLLDLLFLVMIAAAGNYWFLLAAILLLQFSSNISHGAVQGLIPDLVPEEQRGISSGYKAVMELIPLILVALVIANMVSEGKFYEAVAATGAGLMLFMLLTVWLVKEKPLVVKPNIPLGPIMLRVLGMVAGILAGLAAGLLVGGALGGLLALAAWPLAGGQTALNILVGVGGVVAMIVAVAAGVWAGAYFTIGKAVKNHQSFTWWVVNRLLFFSAITSLQRFAAFFLMFAFQITEREAVGMTANLFAVVGICTLLSALPSGWLADRVGFHKLLAVSGIAAGAGSLVLLSTIWLPNLAVIYAAGVILGLATGLFTTNNWALGTRLAPPEEAGRFLGISNLAGAGAGIVGAGLGGPVADYLDRSLPGLGYFVIFLGYGILFVLSSASLRWVRMPAHNFAPGSGGTNRAG